MPDLTDFNDQCAIDGPAFVAELVNNAKPAPPNAQAPWPWDDGTFPNDDQPDYSQPPGATNADLSQTEPGTRAWPDPVIPGVLKTPEIPCDTLPGIWGEMAQAVSDNTQTPPVMSVLSVLGVLATVLQGRYVVDLKTHREILAFWGVTVSASGTRKSAVTGEFLAPLLYWEKLLRDRMRRDIIRNEAVRSTALKHIESLKQSAAKATNEERKGIQDSIEAEERAMPDVLRAPLLFTEDTTPETMQRLVAENAGRMAAISDEPGLFRILGGLYSKGGASLDIFLKGHVGSALKVEREARSVFVQQPCISLCLMIQPDIVADLAGSNQFRASGLMARFCYGVPVSNVGKRNVRNRCFINPHTREAYTQAVLDLLADYPPEVGSDTKPKSLFLDELAEELFLDFSQEIEDKQGDGNLYSPIQDWTSKLPGLTARVAGLLTLAEHGLHATTISHKTMSQAVRLARLLIPHTQAAFGLLGADVIEADALVLMRWIRFGKREEFTQREAHNALQYRFKNVCKLKKALDSLTIGNCIRFETRKPATGRPQTVIRVNPGLLYS